MEQEVKMAIIDLFCSGAHDVAELGKHMSTEQRRLYCKHDCMDRVSELLLHDLEKPFEQVRAFIDEHRELLAELAWQYSGVTYYKV